MCKEIDVTETHDVSDEIMEHDAACCDCGHDHELPEKTADQLIEFRSISNRVYMIDPDAIDWAETSKPENVEGLEQNMQRIRDMLCDLLTEHDDTDDAKNVVFNVVYGFLTDMGIDPLTAYQERIPDIRDFDMAVMLCIDAIELTNVILRHVAVYKTGTDLLSQMFNTMNTMEEQS